MVRNGCVKSSSGRTGDQATFPDENWAISSAEEKARMTWAGISNGVNLFLLEPVRGHIQCNLSSRASSTDPSAPLWPCGYMGVLLSAGHKSNIIALWTSRSSYAKHASNVKAAKEGNSLKYDASVDVLTGPIQSAGIRSDLTALIPRCVWSGL